MGWAVIPSKSAAEKCGLCWLQFNLVMGAVGMLVGIVGFILSLATENCATNQGQYETNNNDVCPVTTTFTLYLRYIYSFS